MLCGCKSKGDYFVAGVEYAQLQLNFEFQVVYSGGSSEFLHDYDESVLVRVLKNVGNQHADVDAGVQNTVFKEFSPGSAIIMSARDWLEAAGIVLDSQDARPDVDGPFNKHVKPNEGEGNNIYPLYRMTGVEVTLTVNCLSAEFHHEQTVRLRRRMDHSFLKTDNFIDFLKSFRKFLEMMRNIWQHVCKFGYILDYSCIF